MDRRALKLAAEERLRAAGPELREAQAAVQETDCELNRARYRKAIENLDLAELAATAALHDCEGSA